MTESLKGQFLVATRQLKDPNFFRAVVLMLDHSEDGAMGVVVNQPGDVTLYDGLSDNVDESLHEELIYVGGPVEQSSLFILHNCRDLNLGDNEVTPGLFIAGSQDSFQAVVERAVSNPITDRFRVFRGYAGWGADQLQGEIQRGDWLTADGDGALSLDPDPYGVWDVCDRRIRRDHRFLNQESPNPEWN